MFQSRSLVLCRARSSQYQSFTSSILPVVTYQAFDYIKLISQKLIFCTKKNFPAKQFDLKCMKMLLHVISIYTQSPLNLHFKGAKKLWLIGKIIQEAGNMLRSRLPTGKIRWKCHINADISHSKCAIQNHEI